MSESDHITSVLIAIYLKVKLESFLEVINGEKEIQRQSADHGGLLDDRIVGLLQIAVQDVAEHTGRVLVQVAGSLSHAVVLAPDGNVDALFLWGDEKLG